MSDGYRAVIIGTSAGGTAALKVLLPLLPAGYPLPVIVVQHLHPLQNGAGMLQFKYSCYLPLAVAEDKGVIKAGYVFFAPPNYHLLFEDASTFALSVDEKVNFARPSIDVSFKSAVAVFGAGLIGVILTGGNRDGAQGLQCIHARGGLTVVQDPKTAESPYMPRAALERIPADHVLSLNDIGRLLAALPETEINAE
ncbi:MAG: chemotaxis protein CheB [Anaerolineae bacterium]|nr:chemotaxis protein CheB [Anaerolineae bacterium]